MPQQYVEKKKGGYCLTGRRVSLDSIVHAYRNWQPAESIAQSFPSLSLEQVHGALAFYLANQSEVESYLDSGRSEFDRARQAAREQDPMFYQKLADARRFAQSARP
ncbi:MAG: DUF433 domain-containing protein [Pirellulales bacterium]